MYPPRNGLYSSRMGDHREDEIEREVEEQGLEQSKSDPNVREAHFFVPLPEPLGLPDQFTFEFVTHPILGFVG